MKNQKKTATLFVARLTKQVTAENLIQVFSTFGRVYKARIIPVEFNEQFNYGFVEAEPCVLQQACASIITLFDVKLIVKPATGQPSERSQTIEEVKKNFARRTVRKFRRKLYGK